MTTKNDNPAIYKRKMNLGEWASEQGSLNAVVWEGASWNWDELHKSDASTYK